MPLRRMPLQGLVVVAAVASWCPLMPVEAAKLWSDPATIWEAADAGDHEEVSPPARVPGAHSQASARRRPRLLPMIFSSALKSSALRRRSSG